MKNIFKMVDELKVGDEVIYGRLGTFEKGKIQRIVKNTTVRSSSSYSQYNLFIASKTSNGSEIVLNIGNLYVLPAKAEIRPEIAKKLLSFERKEAIVSLLTKGMYYDSKENLTSKEFEYYKNLLKDTHDLIRQYQEWDFERRLNEVNVKGGVTDGATQA